VERTGKTIGPLRALCAKPQNRKRKEKKRPAFFIERAKRKRVILAVPLGIFKRETVKACGDWHKTLEESFTNFKYD